ncbi:MAG: hypothetical protein JW900_13585 [Anaerolineae bacterium]|nr:hypothetical protein [Anaerolineae bacterium]
MTRRRIEFVVLAAGAIIGLVLGLLYTWLIDPVEFYNTTPHHLRSDYQHEWIRLAALGYVADGNLQRVTTRLAGLEQQEIDQALGALIEFYADQGQPAATMRALSWLASQLGVDTPAMAVYLGPPPPAPTLPPPPTPPSSPGPTSTAPPEGAAALTPTPTSTPLPPDFPYRVISQTLLCAGTPPQLQVIVQAAPPPAPPEPAEGKESEEEEESTAPDLSLAGVVLWLTWPGGAERAVTGLRPEISRGYADFTLQPDIPYALSIDEPNAPVLSGLTLAMCPEKRGAPQPGTWRIVIERQ